MRLFKTLGVVALIAIAGVAILLGSLLLDPHEVDRATYANWNLQSRSNHICLDR